MLVGIWQKRSKFNETNTALAYEQHGFFEQAQDHYEKVKEKKCSYTYFDCGMVSKQFCCLWKSRANKIFWWKFTRLDYVFAYARKTFLVNTDWFTSIYSNVDFTTLPAYNTYLSYKIVKFSKFKNQL